MGGDWGPEGFSETAKAIQSQMTPVTINSGGGNIILPYVDIRNFTGIYLWAEAVVTGAAAYCPIRVNLFWSGRDDLTGATTDVYRQDYDFWASTGSPGANQEAVFSGISRYQDRCHGTHLSLAFSNFGPSNIQIQYLLLGSTRPWGDSAFSVVSPWDDMLYENSNIPVAAGVNYLIPIQTCQGRIGIHREGIAAPGPTTPLLIQWGSALGAFYAYHNMGVNLVDGNPQNFEIITPRRCAIVRIDSLGGNTLNRLVITNMRERN